MTERVAFLEGPEGRNPDSFLHPIALKVNLRGGVSAFAFGLTVSSLN